ncbi:hypothetical protein NQ318_002947 [Aromia moschata]|uniref:Thyroglobulin type-1 domain-containing protein n=1 Tax=Aromia moschata TaxID=1265417 RepID=A0AAV8X6L6_9CUCU|nr:hypothetical protein NQ318_002947 [Aromia moschata]
MSVFLIVALFFGSVLAEENILCTESFCKDAVCADLPTKCKIQNATHNGIFLPSPVFCNCCEYCLENMLEGDECSTGNPSSPSHTSLCGPQLYCKLRADSDFDGYCTRMEAACLKVQDSYDERRANGTLGAMESRQECDDEGLFAPYRCIPGQTCYCLNKNGTRIFGEAAFTSLPSFNMQCLERARTLPGARSARGRESSATTAQVPPPPRRFSKIARFSDALLRDYEEAVYVIGKELVPSEYFRCTASGDYDTIQCIGEQCLCVDASDGAPTYPDNSLVNLTLISNKTLSCYRGDKDGVFYKKCEAEYIGILNEYKEYKEDGFDMVFGYTFPKCDIDGTYKAVQENSTHKICVDKEGEVLTAVDKVANATLAESMDCKCLRALAVITSDEIPTCDANGNYARVQCRRGVCRCVDSDGNQVCSSTSCEVEESDKESLVCS